jgi:hypothetical protein
MAGPPAGPAADPTGAHTGSVDRDRYRFRSVWHAPASPDECFRALRDLEAYPTWWPEVRAARRLGDSTYRLVVRSLLPYDLAFTTVRRVDDPGRRVLEATLTGDLDGFSRWTVGPHGPGSRLVFEEEVVVGKPWLRRLGAVARPALRANHALMMRHGQRGLRAHLAGSGRTALRRQRSRENPRR